MGDAVVVRLANCPIDEHLPLHFDGSSMGSNAPHGGLYTICLASTREIQPRHMSNVRLLPSWRPKGLTVSGVRQAPPA